MCADVTFEGPWAPLFDGYVAFRRSLGYKVCAGDLGRLAALCRHLGIRPHDPPSLTREAVTEFLESRAACAASTMRGYECMARQFALYLRAKGLDAWVLPEQMITRASNEFAPYIFTSDEMRRIFQVLDEEVRVGPGSRSRLLYQVLFRLLYSDRKAHV